jgi:hypothetical protein
MAHALHAAHRPLAPLRARKLEAERDLKAAKARNLRARVALLASSGAAEVARRVVVELTEREVQKAAAAVVAAAEAEAAADPRQVPLSAWPLAAANRRMEAVRVIAPSAEDAAEPLLAWARAHG